MLTRWWVFLLALLMFGSGLEPGGRSLAEEIPRAGVVSLSLWGDEAVGGPSWREATLAERAAGGPADWPSPESDLLERDLGQLVAEGSADVPLLLPAIRYEPIAAHPGPWFHGPTDPLRRSPVLDGLLRPPSPLAILA